MTIPLPDWSRIRKIRRYQGPLMLAGVRLRRRMLAARLRIRHPPQARPRRQRRSPPTPPPRSASRRASNAARRSGAPAQPPAPRPRPPVGPGGTTPAPTAASPGCGSPAAGAPAAPAPAPKPEPPPEPRFREVTIPAGTALSVSVLSTLGSKTSQVEDPVRGALAEPVVVSGQTALPKGTEITGTVTDAKESGRVKGKALIAFRFERLLFDNENHPIQTARVTIEAGQNKGDDVKKGGAGAGLGAIVGGIAGGGKGAAIGAVAGGTGAVLATKGREVEIAPGTVVTALRAERPDRARADQVAPGSQFPEVSIAELSTYLRHLDLGLWSKEVAAMWSGMDPELRRQYDTLRTMVRLSRQSPAKEWPLVFVTEFESLLVIREWPGGEVTAYTASPRPEQQNGEG